MKHFALKLLVLCLAACFALFLFAACDENKTDTPAETPATIHTHTPGDWVTDKAATCTRDGQKHQICSTCGETIKTKAIPASGHTEVIDPAVAPTCTQTGLTEGKHCSVCGKVIVAQKEVSATGHIGEWVIDKEATCAEKGSKCQVCTVCGTIILIKSIPTTNHTFKWIVDEEATCTEMGSTRQVCTACGKINLTIYIPATGHTVEWVIDKEATCTEEGSKHQVCTVCGKINLATSIPATGHTVEWVIDKEATCTEEGSKHQVCTICGKTTTSEKIPKTHKVVIDTAIAATCTKAGLSEGQHCAICGKVLVEQTTVPAGHTIVIDPAVERTCTTPGKTEGKHCAVCGKVIVSQGTIPAKHTEIVVDPAVAPTCIKTGLTEGKHCKACGEVIVEQNAIPTTNHTYKEGVCTICGQQKLSEKLEFTTNGDGTCHVSGIGTCTDTEIFIPSISPIGDIVTSIMKEAFMDCKTLKSVTIPDSVINIGSRAFCDCSSLTKVKIGNGVQAIGQYAFYGCSLLMRVDISDLAKWCSVSLEHFTSNPLFNGAKLYINDNLITDLIISGNVKSIANGVFYNCASIKSVVISNNVTSIGQSVFTGCPIEFATIPAIACSSVNNINLKTVVITSGSTIGRGAFYNCSALESITIPVSVTSVESSAFQGCTKLKKIIYLGTREEWKAVSKGEDWNFNTSEYIFEFPNDPNA